MLEMNMTIAFPAAPLLTVILALVGGWKLKISLLSSIYWLQITFHPVCRDGSHHV